MSLLAALVLTPLAASLQASALVEQRKAALLTSLATLNRAPTPSARDAVLLAEQLQQRR